MNYLNHQSDSYGTYKTMDPKSIHLFPTYEYDNSSAIMSGKNTLVNYKDFVYGPIGYETIDTTNNVVEPDILGGRNFGQYRNKKSNKKKNKNKKNKKSKSKKSKNKKSKKSRYGQSRLLTTYGPTTIDSGSYNYNKI